jgi:hypothetical protein
MSAETVLRDALLALPGVAAIVGVRIYPIVVQEGDPLPAIAFQRMSTEYTNTIGNTAVADKVTFDVMCIAEAFDDAEALCDAAEAVAFEKANRAATYDPDTRTFASVLTVNVWV